MDDKTAINLLSESLANLSERIKEQPYMFYVYFSSWTSQIAQMTRQFKNDNFRYFGLMLYSIRDALKVYFSRLLKEAVLKKLKESFESEKEIRAELIMSAVSEIDVNSIGDTQGNDVVDVEEVMRDVKAKLTDFDEATVTVAILTISNALRKVYNETTLIQGFQKETLDLCEKLIKASKESWDKAYSTQKELMIELDSKASMWK